MRKSKLSAVLFSLAMILILAILSLLVACEGEDITTTATTTETATATTTTTSTATTTATATVTAKPMRLSLAYHFPPTSGTGITLEELAARIEEKTEGRISFDVYPAASLVASGDQYDACVSGIADIVFTSINGEPDVWPLSQVLIQPAVGVPIGLPSSDYFKEVYDTIPELKAEVMNDIKVLMLWRSLSETNIHTTDKEVRVPADLAGLKIIAIGSFVEFLKVVGATPLALAPTEHYMSIERGMAEGLLIPYTVMNIHGTTELLPHHLSLDLAGPPFMLIMNLDKWNSLSAADQKIFEESCDWATEKVIERSNADMVKVFGIMEDLGHTIIDPTPAEFKIWQEASKPMADNWLEDNKDKPAQVILDKVTELAEKYR